MDAARKKIILSVASSFIDYSLNSCLCFDNFLTLNRANIYSEPLINAIPVVLHFFTSKW